MSSLFRLKIAYAQPIANPDLLWDKITSIEPLAPEPVYDIEVEDTHNFIGNGIFAHNTYIGTLPPEESQAASSAQRATKTGGIDLSQIELTLKDEKYISSLNPADLKVLRAAKYLKEGWDSLSVLYIHEIMLLLKDGLIKDIQNKELLSGILNQLKLRDFLDPQALHFLNLIQSEKPLAEVKFALLK